MRYLVRLTYVNDHLLRMRAIECLGKVAAVRADSHPEEIRDLIRRFVWSMNDESRTVSWSAPQIIAEIIYHRPELYEEFGSVMVNASWDEETFQQGMLWGIGRLSEKISYIEEISEKITEFLLHSKPEIRGYAVWALGEIKYAQAAEKISSLLNAKEKI